MIRLTIQVSCCNQLSKIQPHNQVNNTKSEGKCSIKQIRMHSTFWMMIPLLSCRMMIEAIAQTYFSFDLNKASTIRLSMRL